MHSAFFDLISFQAPKKLDPAGSNCSILEVRLDPQKGIESVLNSFLVHHLQNLLKLVGGFNPFEKY